MILNGAIAGAYASPYKILIIGDAKSEKRSETPTDT